MLEERLEFTRERIFRLLGMIYPQKEILSVWSRLENGRPAVRAQALEYLANVFDSEHRDKLYPLLEPPSWADVEVASRALTAPRPPSFALALRSLSRSDDAWIAACAATLIGDYPLPALADSLSSLRSHGVPFVREAAERAIESLAASRVAAT